ncbi:rhodopsin, GQ-coupled-like [Stylophora pistillata]|uniref:rhodopsin, GQ-coupled-like n=1 Tax=Stylophora pistillata TaxID=50429 RepID=UPI000C03E3F0|nr:rhodopsin, GQ-coupled-like [Stylophora pistillata]
MSESPTHDPLGRSRTEIDVEVTMAILVCLSAVAGNLLVVYAINRDSRLHNVTNIFISNLALTDIAAATIDMPFWIASLYAGTRNFSQVWCQIAGLAFSILAVASIFTIGLITFNRYLKVVKPILYKKVFPSKKAAWLYCVLVWLVAIFRGVPILSGGIGVSYKTKLGVCTSESGILSQFVTGVFIYGVLIIIFYCHFKIYKAVRESTNNLNAHGERNGSSNDSRRSADVRVLKTCFTVACFYVITWFPISIIVVIWPFGYDIPQVVCTGSIFLMFSSSLVNPFIYGVMNPQFKLAFKRALSCGRYGNGNTDLNHLRNRVRREVARGLESAA